MQYKLTGMAKFLEEQINLDFTPLQGTKGSSGFDLSACIDTETVILPSETVKIDTGVHIWIGSEWEGVAIPDGMLIAGMLMPRSSIRGLMLTNSIGLCDSDYQGEYICSLYNYTEDLIRVKPGQKIVQVVFVPTYVPEEMKRVEDFVSTTTRGTGAFGHTDSKDYPEHKEEVYRRVREAASLGPIAKGMLEEERRRLNEFVEQEKTKQEVKLNMEEEAKFKSLTTKAIEVKTRVAPNLIGTPNGK